MNLSISNTFNNFGEIKELLETVTGHAEKITAVTPFYGSTKSLFIRELFNHENSIGFKLNSKKKANG